MLAHGLFGFDELRLAGSFLPGIEYWRGITSALEQRGVEVIICHVSPSGSVESRAAKLAENIAERAGGKSVNIIAYVRDFRRKWHRLLLTTISIVIAWYMEIIERILWDDC